MLAKMHALRSSLKETDKVFSPYGGSRETHVQKGRNAYLVIVIGDADRVTNDVGPRTVIFAVEV